MGQQRRQFSPEFKAAAVALVRSTGRPIAAIAKELGVGESNLSYWPKKDQESRASADPGRFEAESAEARENVALTGFAGHSTSSRWQYDSRSFRPARSVMHADRPTQHCRAGCFPSG
jgi:transposase